MPQLYEIRIESHLEGEWSDWFEGLSIQNQPGDGALLRGSVVDQAALLGLLNKVHAMNLTITSVCRVSQPTESRAEIRPQYATPTEQKRHTKEVQMKRAEIVRYIQEAHFGYLATVDPEGAPRVRPMGIHTVYGDNLYFFTFGTTRKVAELDRNHRVEVVWAKTDEQSQVRITGTVAIEDNKAVIQRFRKDNPIIARMLPREAEHLFRLYRIEPKTVEIADGLVPYSRIDWRIDGKAPDETKNAR